MGKYGRFEYNRVFLNVIVSKNKTFFAIKYACLLKKLETQFKITEYKDINDIIFIAKTSHSCTFSLQTSNALKMFDNFFRQYILFLFFMSAMVRNIIYSSVQIYILCRSKRIYW